MDGVEGRSGRRGADRGTGTPDDGGRTVTVPTEDRSLRTTSTHPSSLPPTDPPLNPQVYPVDYTRGGERKV